MTIRIYQPASIEIAQTFLLNEKASHHVGRVLRAEIGDELVLFNGMQKGDYHATITSITKKTVTVKITSFTERDVSPRIHIHLAQGLAKGEKMDWIIQKAVELGVSEITPLITEYSNVKLTKEREEKRLAHWQEVIVSASEQSGRVDLPLLNAPCSFKTFLTTKHADKYFILSPRGNTGFSKEKLPDGAKVMLCIGPEGGFSEAEIKLADSFLSIKMGARILRTETAALAAITSIQLLFGDF